MTPCRTLRLSSVWEGSETDPVEWRLRRGGIDRVLQWFRQDVERTLSLLGVSTVADLDRALLYPDPTTEGQR